MEAHIIVYRKLVADYKALVSWADADSGLGRNIQQSWADLSDRVRAQVAASDAPREAVAEMVNDALEDWLADWEERINDWHSD
mgnify:CR=1 FL=1